MEPETYSLSRYLSAKRSVDERALNRRVWEAFIHELVDRRSSGDAVRILEVAGGIGSTVARILNVLPKARFSRVHYRLVDIDADLIESAYEGLPNWGREEGFAVRTVSDGLEFVREEGTLFLELVNRDAFRVLDEVESSMYDAVIAQAWLDLVNLETILERIFRVLSDEGLFYAPIHFDGETRFLPSVDETLDQKILELYHRSMDERDTPYGTAGGSRTGSRLLTELPATGGRIEAAGASDWIVCPRSDGSYPEDEVYFLHHVMQFVEDEIADHSHLDPEGFRDWVRGRRRQIDAGELIYLAHQLDVLARPP